MTDPVFVLQSHAADFVSRDIGRLLREQLLQLEIAIPEDQRITIDASGVVIMTPSFVDEFFGRTAALLGLERFQSRFHIVGIDGENRTLVNNVVRNRLILHRRSGVGGSAVDVE
ncbi:STAS-like domain-containing protein [Planctellipticum variicoloris]|uniref:STAS-like domain-containing protein n=1 Tax=Planctellipticum variicoloris TaxID=3064265 RepID=UPI002C0629B6|nr:STAS-like domain-containing protein [Planctomycetaceae bacterium SH412]HTN00273.1 DUF4325 domain-containing protein [Planctomycetaceae bacterium]